MSILSEMRFQPFALVGVILVLFTALASCQRTPEPLPTGLAGYDPHLVENTRAECEARGGRFGKGGLSGAFVCYEDTKDANKPCSSGKDCDGLCLARSRSCSPVKPIFGCHEILTNSGRISTICLD